MTPLQQELFDLIREDADILVEDEAEAEALRNDIMKLNAIELRYNIKVWKETA